MSGVHLCDPTQIDRCPCFINKNYEMGTEFAGASMWFSHLEIVTFDGMQNFVKEYLKTKEGLDKIFPEQGITDALNSSIET